jgi:hypothetical protein
VARAHSHSGLKAFRRTPHRDTPLTGGRDGGNYRLGSVERERKRASVADTNDATVAPHPPRHTPRARCARVVGRVRIFSGAVASWPETRGVAALLTMRIYWTYPEEAPTGRANARPMAPSRRMKPRDARPGYACSSTPASVNGNATPGRQSKTGRISYMALGLTWRSSRAAAMAASRSAQSMT